MIPSTLVTLAYKYVATLAMLCECQHFSQQLDLPIKGELSLTNVAKVYVCPPKILGFGGSMRVENYEFNFTDGKGLYNIVRVDRFGSVSWEELLSRLAREKSLIGTNEAYELATNWLSVVGVDVAKLEMKYRHTVSQHSLSPVDNDSVGRTNVVIPLFYVDWGGGDVTMTIYGTTKELLDMRIEDASLSTRPKRFIKNWETLLAIPDAEFLKYSDPQRMELFKKHSLVKFPQPTPQRIFSHSATNVLRIGDKPTEKK